MLARIPLLLTQWLAVLPLAWVRALGWMVGAWRGLPDDKDETPAGPLTLFLKYICLTTEDAGPQGQPTGADSSADELVQLLDPCSYRLGFCATHVDWHGKA